MGSLCAGGDPLQESMGHGSGAWVGCLVGCPGPLCLLVPGDAVGIRQANVRQVVLDGLGMGSARHG